MKILAIGNSFSQDALAQLHDVAVCGGLDVLIANLYIGGCDLATHWLNATDDRLAYELERNGQSTGTVCSIREALCSEPWDVVTFQQASHDSGFLATYHPYLGFLSDVVREYCPGGRQWLHQTWAYDIDSDHSAFVRYHRDPNAMFLALKHAYQSVSMEFGMPIIPSGEVIQRLRSTPPFDVMTGGSSLCRDGYHMDLVYGRFALAAAWYETLLGGDIRANGYVPLGEDGAVVDLCRIGRIRDVVHEVCAGRCSMREHG
jgi:hypothetical protein